MPSPKTVSVTRQVKIASFVLAAMLCIGTLIYGLLPGLLTVFLGYLFAAVLAGESRTKGLRLSPTMAATVVVLLPIVGLGFLLANAKGMAFGAVGQYQRQPHINLARRRAENWSSRKTTIKIAIRMVATWSYWNMSKRPLSSCPIPPAPTRPITVAMRMLRSRM